jgi:hypothetical protein
VLRPKLERTGVSVSAAWSSFVTSNARNDIGEA